MRQIYPILFILFDLPSIGVTQSLKQIKKPFGIAQIFHGKLDVHGLKLKSQSKLKTQ
jgi:hypothetical protein